MSYELTKEKFEKCYSFLFKKYGFVVSRYVWDRSFGNEIIELENEKLKIVLRIVKDRGHFDLSIWNRKYYTIRWHDFEELCKNFIASPKKPIEMSNTQSLDNVVDRLKLYLDQVIELFSDEKYKEIVEYEQRQAAKNKKIDKEQFVSRFGGKTADSIIQSLELLETEGQKVRDIDLKIVEKIQQGRRLTRELVAEIIEESPVF